MRDVTTRFLIFLACALIIVAAPSFAAVAQEKKDEGKKTTSTVDAWREALPPQTQSTAAAEEAAVSGTPARASREEIEKSLLALERKWMEALKLRDASTLSQVIADDFSFVGPHTAGTLADRNKYLNQALRDVKLNSYEFDGLTVRLYGRAAIVTGRLKQNATATGGGDLSGSYFVTDVWISRDGIWRVVSRHASLLPVAK